MTTLMHDRIVVLVVPAVASLLLGGGSDLAAQTATVFRDDFNGSFSSAWSIVRPDASYYSIRPTHLELRACNGDLWRSFNTATNVFLIDNPATGDFTVTMRLDSFVPTSYTNAPQIAIVAYDNDDNYVRATYGVSSLSNYQRCMELATEISGNYSSTVLVHDFGSSPFYLRLEKTDDRYTHFYSTDGVAFHQSLAPVVYAGAASKLGFVAMVDPYQSSYAYIDYFEVSVVPEPSSLAMLVVAMACLWAFKRPRK